MLNVLFKRNRKLNITSSILFLNLFISIFILLFFSVYYGIHMLKGKKGLEGRRELEKLENCKIYDQYTIAALVCTCKISY